MRFGCGEMIPTTYKYPFLNVKVPTLQFLSTKTGKDVSELATHRIERAMEKYKRSEPIDVDEYEINIEPYIYSTSCIISSCLGDEYIMEKLAKYESRRAYTFIKSESFENKLQLANYINFKIDDMKIPVTFYVPLSLNMYETKWKLVNRDVENGNVFIDDTEFNLLLKEHIYNIVKEKLPLKINSDYCVLLIKYIERINPSKRPEHIQKLNIIDEDIFPPCIRKLISDLSRGANLTHMGRFTLTTFLNGIGYNKKKIFDMYNRSPDFDVNKTIYQITHITSKQDGKGYTPPSCAAMKTNGLCVEGDNLCQYIKHPLNYYNKKKYKKYMDIQKHM